MSQAPPIEQRIIVGAVAASTVYNTVGIDLGPASTRVHTHILALKSGIPSTGEYTQIQFSDDNLSWYQSPDAAGATGNPYNGTSGYNMNSQARVMGRYMRLTFSNGTTAQTNLLIFLTALSGVSV